MAGKDIQKEIAIIVKMFDEAAVVKKQLASDKVELKCVQETHSDLVDTIDKLRVRKVKAANGARVAEAKAGEVIKESKTICLGERKKASDEYIAAIDESKATIKNNKAAAEAWKNKATEAEERYGKIEKKIAKLKKDIG